MSVTTHYSAPIRAGAQVDDIILIDLPMPSTKYSFAPGARRFGLSEDDDIMDMDIPSSSSDLTCERPLTIRDLASPPSSPPPPEAPPITASTPSTSLMNHSTPSSSSSSLFSNHLLINPAHVGSIPTSRLQSVKRNFATSFSFASTETPSALSKQPSSHSDSSTSVTIDSINATKDDSDFTQSSPPKRIRIFNHVKNSTTKTPSSLSTEIFNSNTTTGPVTELYSLALQIRTPARLRVNFFDNPSVSVVASRVPAFLFGVKGLTARFINSKELLHLKFGDQYNSIHPERATFSIDRTPNTVLPHPDTISDAKAMLHIVRDAIEYEPSEKNGISAPLARSIQPFSFASASTCIPTPSPARTALDLLGVVLDANLPPNNEIEGAPVLSDLQSKARLQRWLAKHLALNATIAAKECLSAGKPLAAICKLMESRQLGAACAVATSHGFPRLALFLASTSSNPSDAYKYVTDVMNSQTSTETVSKEYIKIIQLASLAPVSDSDSGDVLPEWATDALHGLSVTQALLHLLATMPTMSIPDIVVLMLGLESIVTEPDPGSADAMLLDVMILATSRDARDHARRVVWAIATGTTDNTPSVADWVALAVASAGLVAHQVQVDPHDYLQLIMRTVAELEAVGCWDLAVSVMQLIGIVPVNRRNAYRYLEDLLTRNVTGEIITSPSTTTTTFDSHSYNMDWDSLSSQDQWILKSCQVTLSSLVEAKAARISTYIESSSLSIPRPGTSSSQNSEKESSMLLAPTAPRTLIRRPQHSKSTSDRTNEHARILHLLSLTTTNPSPLNNILIGNLSATAMQMAVRAIRVLVPTYILDGDMDKAIMAVTKFEQLVNSPAGTDELPGGLAHPVIIEAVRTAQNVILDNSNSSSDACTGMAVSATHTLVRFIERRAPELSEIECAAIHVLLSVVKCRSGLHIRPQLTSK